MNREELLAKMETIAKRNVKHYYSDFTDYDIPRLRAVDKKTAFTWLVRDCGTWLMENHNGEPNQYLPIIRSQYENYKEYTITYDGTWKIKKERMAWNSTK